MDVNIKVLSVKFKWTCPNCGHEQIDYFLDYVGNDNKENAEMYCDVCGAQFEVGLVE